jgi:cyanophycinase
MQMIRRAPQRFVAANLWVSFLLISSLGQVSSGPSKGTLILSAAGPDVDAALAARFVTAAGGADAEFVYIPTASSGIKLASGFIYIPPETDSDRKNVQAFEQELSKIFRVKKIMVLHTRDRKTANSEAFAQAIRKANGVWFSGGNSGRLASTYLNTLVHRELQALLDRGGVIGGESAGAIIQGSYTVRGRPDKPLLMAKGHERGFGFLKNVAVNPHLISAQRENELVNVVDANPKLLGIGIDDKAAIVVQGDRFEVIGESKIAIYDNQLHDGKWYYWLTPGTVFNLRTRVIESGGMEKAK